MHMLPAASILVHPLIGHVCCMRAFQICKARNGSSHAAFCSGQPLTFCPGFLKFPIAMQWLQSHILNTLHVQQHLNARVLLFPDPVYNLEHSRLCSRLCTPPSHLQRTHPPLLLLQYPHCRQLVKQTFSWLPAVAEKMSDPGVDQQT